MSYSTKQKYYVQNQEIKFKSQQNQMIVLKPILLNKLHFQTNVLQAKLLLLDKEGATVTQMTTNNGEFDY